MKFTILMFGLLLSLASAASAGSYSWDFRNGHFDNLSLVPTGAGAVNLLEPTDAGLSITVPAGHNVKTVGFSPRFVIRGDFEISVDFTIISRTQPKSGYGSGPSLYLSMGSTKDSAVSLARTLRKDGRDIYAAFAARVEEGQRIPTAKLFDVPEVNKSLTGRLRIQRIKHEIIYSVADDIILDFRPLVTLPVSDADVTMLRVGLNQSDPDSAATIVLHSIQIVADELPHLPSEQSRTAQLYRPRYQPPPRPTSYRWLWQTLAALCVAGGFGTWWWKRR